MQIKPHLEAKKRLLSAIRNLHGITAVQIKTLTELANTALVEAFENGEEAGIETMETVLEEEDEH